MSDSVYRGQYRIYRAPKDPTKGVALKLDFRQDKDNFDKGLLFVTMAQQTGFDENGNGRYAWDDKAQRVIFKLGEVDIGEILAVLNGVKDSLGTKGTLFHQTPKGGNSTMALTPNEKGFFVKLSYQDTDKKVISLALNMSAGEAELFRLYVINAVNKSWGF